MYALGTQMISWQILLDFILQGIVSVCFLGPMLILLMQMPMLIFLFNYFDHRVSTITELWHFSSYTQKQTCPCCDDLMSPELS